MEYGRKENIWNKRGRRIYGIREEGEYMEQGRTE